ncbi:MAG: ATP-binding cassette domain-containing protein [Thermotogota bacterium]|nr:ATP-binding cassette domain-containing protein [Thermotogota bacterium]
MSLTDDPLMQLNGITKIYPNQVVANDNINLTLQRGRIHVILGENGAGKITLMNILFGLIQPTFGEMIFKGKKTRFQTTFESIQAGIGMIHQHFKLVPSLSVLENCYLGIEPKRFFFINHRKMKETLKKFLTQYDISHIPQSTIQKVKIQIISKKQKDYNIL